MTSAPMPEPIDKAREPALFADKGGRLEDEIAWDILQALHKDVSEAERPMSWSDVNGEQEKRLRAAAYAAMSRTANFLAWADTTLSSAPEPAPVAEQCSGGRDRHEWYVGIKHGFSVCRQCGAEEPMPEHERAARDHLRKKSLAADKDVEVIGKVLDTAAPVAGMAEIEKVVATLIELLEFRRIYGANPPLSIDETDAIATTIDALAKRDAEIERLRASLEAARPAWENLGKCQRQLDMDGCEVGVSRQAVDETIEAIRAALASEPKTGSTEP